MLLWLVFALLSAGVLVALLRPLMGQSKSAHAGRDGPSAVYRDQLAEIEHVCDDVTIIDHGRLVATGTLSEVRAHAGGDLVVVTIDERERAMHVLNAAGLPARPRPENSEIVVDVEPEAAARVTEVLARDGLFLRGLRTQHATLEAAFLNLTGGPPPPVLSPPPPPQEEGK